MPDKVGRLINEAIQRQKEKTMAKQKIAHVFVDGSGHEIALDADLGVPNNEVEYRVTMTTVVLDENAQVVFKHYVAR